MRVLTSLLLTVSALILLKAESAGAQEERLWLRPALGAHLGFVSPEQARNGAEFGINMDVGSVRYQRARLVIGLDRFSSKSRRPGADGSFSNVAISTDLRYKPFRVSGFSPYLGVGIGVNFRSTSATDPNIEAIYDGVAVGGQAFLGANVDMDPTGRWGISTELRATAVQNVDRTTLRVGVFRRL